MYLEKFGIFVLFLGPLVFFHELGHFFFARLFGVRVEVFSIGFGPKLLKFKRGDTQYAVSLIPLGGYVKMFGDDPLNKDAIPEEDRKFSFTFKNKWQRFWIVMGGPLANFVMAYVIFFTLLMSGERLPELKIGVIPDKSSFYDYGLRSGDIIKKVNGAEVYNPTDILLEGDDLIKTMTVGRQKRDLTITLNLTGETFFSEFSKYPPTLRFPLVYNNNGETFLLGVENEKVNWSLSYDQLEQTWNSREPLFLFPVSINDNGKTKEEIFKVLDKPSLKLNLGSYTKLDIALTENGYKTSDLGIKKVNKKSPADNVGLKEKDVIISLDGAPVYSFESLRENLQNIKKETVEVKVWREGNEKSFMLTPEVRNIDGKAVKLIGVYSAGIFQPLNYINTKPKGIGEAFIISFGRTWDTISKTLEGFKKLVTAEVSFKTIGGPLAIGKVASDSFNTSLSYFFQLMALISVNLGVINLFPIPVLDGGHILFILLEVINGGPVSRRKMEIAQQVGLSLLLLLMFGALFNDFTRFF
jgi:regulator of sigma E protease